MRLRSFFPSLLSLTIVSLLTLVGTASYSSVYKSRLEIADLQKSYQNPNIYIVGRVVGGKVMHDSKGRYFTSVLFQPYNTALLYTESLLFCNDVSKLLETNQLIIITYKKNAYRVFEGIGCHVIENVLPVRE